MASLCREFGISRKTGYKIFERYEQCGLEGLSDRVRRPFRYANQLPAQLEAAIGNVAGSIGGVICDGAKSGCALKLATAAGVAIEAAYLARLGTAIPPNDGIVCATADETIALLGVIASRGMVETDRTLCQAIIGREKA